jgi:hypothetical protein
MRGCHLAFAPCSIWSHRVRFVVSPRPCRRANRVARWDRAVLGRGARGVGCMASALLVLGGGLTLAPLTTSSASGALVPRAEQPGAVELTGAGSTFDAPFFSAALRSTTSFTRPCRSATPLRAAATASRSSLPGGGLRRIRCPNDASRAARGLRAVAPCHPSARQGHPQRGDRADRQRSPEMRRRWSAQPADAIPRPSWERRFGPTPRLTCVFVVVEGGPNPRLLLPKAEKIR